LVFPWVAFLKERRKRLSDIEYLAIKEFGGKLRQSDTPAKTTIGDLVTLTANTGKDMYLAKAKIQSHTTGVGSLTVQLKVNTVPIEEFKMSVVASTLIQEFKFVSSGFKVLAGEIIKLEVTVATNISVGGQLICFEENTGDTPVV